MQINGASQTAASSIAIFAHELREPLASILYAAEAAGETANNEETNREMWDVVGRQGKHLARIIEQVLTHSRSNRTTVAPCKEWINLGAAITDAVESVKPLVVNRGHCLTVSLPSDHVYLMADSVQLQQIVTNLLANAAKYTEPGGCIDLAVTAADDLVVIEVRDNGVGIPAEILPRVFNLFEQGNQGGLSGLGVGLALVKSLVELHGGRVSAQSAGIGAGSVFVVQLPAATSTVHRLSASGQSERWRGDAMIDA